MTTEQLNQARAAVWHQAGNPLLTADDAAAWLRETGVSFFLPRTQQLATAAPSFVEAVLGASHATPAREAIENANRLLERLLASGDAIALNLLGTPGEQPDFLATTETLPFLFALIGDKEWKRGPRGKSSPLVIEVWKLLDREGPLTTIEVKEKLGRQLTEAAALRALTELWSHLRIEPVLQEGASASWQLLERSRQKQMQAGSTMSQAVALSALVSLYLQSAVAASGDEIEVFLSPLASLSKVREVVRGLTATRQLSTLNLGPVEMYHVEGSLPEFPEIPEVEGMVVEVTEEGLAASSEAMGEGRRRFVAKRLAAEAGDIGVTASSGTDRASRPAKKAPGQGPGNRPSRGGDKTAARGPARSAAPSEDNFKTDRRPFAPRPGTTGERKPYGTRAPGGSSFNPREPWKEDRKPPAPRSEGEDRRPFARSREESSTERKPFAPRIGERPFKPRPEARQFGERKSFGERKPFSTREGGDRKPFVPRDGGAGERKPFSPRAGDRPFKPRSDAKPFAERKSFGDRKPFAPREGASAERRPFASRGGDRPFKPGSDAKPFRKPFTPREGGAGEHKASSPRGGDRTFKPRPGAKPFGKSYGGGKPFTPREGSERKSFTPREGAAGERPSFAPRGGDRPFSSRPRDGAERKPFSPRSGGDRKPFTPREGSGGERKSFSPRNGDRPFRPRPEAKPFGERKSFSGPKPFAPREGGERKPFTPRAGGAKPFKPGSARTDKPRFDTSRSSAGRQERPSSPRPSFSPRPSIDRGGPAGPGARKSTGVRKTTGTTRARTAPTTSSGKPRSGVRPPLGRPGPRATRGGATGAPGRIKRTPRPGKGRSK